MLVSPHVGGGARLAMEIHRHAVSTRGSVSQLWLPPGGAAERLARENAFPYEPYQLARLTSTSVLRSGLENLSLLRRTARFRNAVIHVHAPFVFGAARPFLRLSSLRTVLHIHLDFTAEQLRWALRWPPDLIIVCANFMRPAVEEALPEGAGRKAEIRVIHNAVDTKRFFPVERAAAKERLGVPPDVPLAMVIANLAPHKGQETAVRAMARLKEQGRNIRLWLVGQERDDGRGFLRHLRDLSESLGVTDRVDFVGFRDDVPQLLQAADFLLLPSTSEGLPLVILEAQASKALVLAAPTAGIPEIIEDGRTGFLIAAGDDLAYASRIGSLLDDPAAAASIVSAAYDQVRQHFSMPQYCERTLAEYDALLAGGRASS